jgi:hypothetical protein
MLTIARPEQSAYPACWARRQSRNDRGVSDSTPGDPSRSPAALRRPGLAAILAQRSSPGAIVSPFWTAEESSLGRAKLLEISEKRLLPIAWHSFCFSGRSWEAA